LRRPRAHRSPARPGTGTGRAAPGHSAASARSSRPVRGRAAADATGSAPGQAPARHPPVQTAAADDGVRACRCLDRDWRNLGSWTAPLAGSTLDIEQRTKFGIDGFTCAEDPRTHRADRTLHLLRDLLVA